MRDFIGIRMRHLYMVHGLLNGNTEQDSSRCESSLGSEQALSAILLDAYYKGMRDDMCLWVMNLFWATLKLTHITGVT